MISKCAVTIVVTITCIVGCGSQECEKPIEDSLAGYLPLESGLNVVVISFDALRADVLGVYGSDLGATPNMDAFAERSLLFTEARTAAQATPTSFASMFTGQLPHHVFRGWELVETQTIAKVFKRAGYDTVGLMNNFQLPAKRNFDQGFDVYSDAATDSRGGKGPRGNDGKNLKRAKEWLRENHQRKFFAWFHFISPHQPYDYREMAERFYDLNYTGEFVEGTGKGNAYMDADPSEYPRIRSLYNGEVFFADSIFASLIAELEALGLMENTIVVLTSDHGEQFMEHGDFAHNRVYEQVIALPMMIYHPSVRRGHVSSVPYSNIDLLPTLASILGLDYSDHVEGVDLSSVNPVDRPHVSIAMTGRKYRSAGIQDRRHKLIAFCRSLFSADEEFEEPRFDIPERHPLETRDLRFELYDLQLDPHERANLVVAKPDLASSLFGVLTETLGEDPCKTIADATKGVPEENKLDEDTIEKLKALGYIN